MLGKNLQIYLKTTETCNLNCKHCFTSGSNGAKIYFNPEKTAKFIGQIVNKTRPQSMRILYHGGEPMLAPVKDLYTLYNATRHLDTQMTYGMQTNLVYKLTDKKIEFMNEVLKPYGIGTSYDYGIRFGSNQPGNINAQRRDKAIWEENVKVLVKEGHTLSLMVCLSKEFIKNVPITGFVEYASDLGFKYILFERITGDGNAVENPDIFPKNKDIDDWFVRLYEETIKNKLYEKIGNMFLNEIATSFLKKQHVANRCRNCEQHLITINADGSLSGCPNSAPNVKWGTIDQDLFEVLRSETRMKAICKEMTRNPVCATCPVNDICNGDCYKLPWEGDICAAPKSLMKHIKVSEDYKNLEKLLLN